MELCATGKGCYSNEYKDFAFENLDTILDMTSTSQIDFEAWWAGEVASEFDLEESDVVSCYGSDDPYSTDGNLRALWKYGTGKGVNGTPTGFINGVKINDLPMTVDSWMDLLNSTYNSKFGVADL